MKKTAQSVKYHLQRRGQSFAACLSNTRVGRDRSLRRQGSLYVAVLLVGVIVSVLGLSAVLVGRINSRAYSGLSDMTIARMNAKSAIRLGMLEIENDPNWRFSHLSDDWFTDKPLGGGTYSLIVRDPSDDDVSDAAADPLILTGIGRSGDAVHRTQITLAPLYRGYDCLRSAIHAGDDLRFYDGQIDINHPVSANDDVSASNAYVSVNVSAGDIVSGWQFSGETEENADLRTLPDPDDVLQFYRDNGTWIDADDLPRQFASIIRNGEFERGSDFWQEENATIVADTNGAYSGQQCLKITGRSDDYSGVSQDVHSLLLSGRTYDIDIAVSAREAITLYVHLEVEDEYGSDDHVSEPVSVTAGGEWEMASVRIQPWFNGDLSSAKLIINTSPVRNLYGGMGTYDLGFDVSESMPTTAPADFRIDSVIVRERGSDRNIDQVLLSPQHNPFGETNARGIYVIDMKGSRLIVRNSRIHGTLVIIDPAGSTEFGDEGSLAMSAADSKLPTLIVVGSSFYINPSDRGLSETAMQVNLNPADAPWPGIGSDTDMLDAYSSGIQGMIYTSHRVRISNVPVHGAIISDNDVYIESSFSMTYDNRFYRNPPPGFSGPEQIRILLGSARRVAE